jgi:hypothetical protein
VAHVHAPARRGRRADAQVRRTAYARIEAAFAAAKAAVAAWEAEALTALIADGLTTSDAKRWFESLPKATDLLPESIVGEMSQLTFRPAKDAH